MNRKIGLALTWLVLVTLLISVFGAVPALADTITVDDDGGADYTSIQDAVDAASDNDIISVAPGTYEETISIDKPLTLRGATHTVNKNGYSIPSGYNWDDTVESIIQVSGDETIVTITADDVTLEGFVIQALHRSSSGTRHLVEVQADGHGKNLESIVIENNVIGPNTNVDTQDGSKGRMNLYIAINQYQATPWGLTDSLIAGNKIFGSEGNGNAVFIWGAYYAYGARNPSPMTGTVIEDNEVCCGHRNGIEVAGGISDLVIRDNDIHDFSGLTGDDPDMLKYGSGILLIRGASDKTDCDGLGPVDLAIENNAIYDNEKNGVYMGPQNQGVAITGNDIHDNGWDAVRLDLIGNYWNPDFDPNPGPYTCLGGSQNVTASSNSFEDNGAGVQVIGTPSNGFLLNAESNWWGDPSGPADPAGTDEVPPCDGDCTDDLNSDGAGDSVSDHVDYCPWTEADLWVELNDEWVAECNDDTITVDIVITADNFNGVEFDLDFDETLLGVVDADGDPGNGRQITKGSMWPASTTVIQNTVNNASGVVSFGAYLQAADTDMSVTGGQVAQVEFYGKEAGVSILDLNDVIVSNLEGASLDVLLEDTTLDVTGCGCVHGIVEVQGRFGPDWDDAQVTLSGGPGGAYGPATSADDGYWQICDVVEGDYDVTVEMARYLDGFKAGVSIVDDGDTDTGQVKVLGGDADDTTDGTTPNTTPGTADIINIYDASILASDFGKTSGFDVRADINDDGKVNILDCALLGGNWFKSSPVPW